MGLVSIAGGNYLAFALRARVSWLDSPCDRSIGAGRVGGGDKAVGEVGGDEAHRGIGLGSRGAGVPGQQGLPEPELDATPIGVRHGMGSVTSPLTRTVPRRGPGRISLSGIPLLEVPTKPEAHRRVLACSLASRLRKEPA